MKKHFLLLMLMALLPLAGFAKTDISEFEFKIEKTSFEYSGATPSFQTKVTHPNVIDPLTYQTHYELVYYKDGAEITADNVKNIGTYQVAAKGIGDEYEGETVKVTFYITQISMTSLKVIISDFDYSECRPEEEEEISKAAYDGEAWTPSAAVTWKANDDAEEVPLEKGKDYMVNYENNTDAGTATVTFTATTGGNFTGSVEKTFNIAKIDIDEDNVTIPTNLELLTYKGELQNLIKEGTVDSQYGTMMYKLSDADENAWSTSIPQAKDAGTYTVNWKIKGSKNYNDYNVGEDASTVSGINIAKKSLTVMPLPKEKVYDGDAFDLETAQFSIAGRVGEDISKAVTGLSAQFVSENINPVSAINKGDYTVKAVVTEDEEGQTKIGNVALSKNYDIDVDKTATWTVNARPVTITVANASMVFGAISYPQPQISVEKVGENRGALDDDDAETIGGYFTVNNNYTDDVTEGDPSSAPVGTYEEFFSATPKNNASVNYDYEVVKGTLTIKGAGFNVMPIVADVQYGDSYTIGYFTDGKIDEDKLVFVIGNDEYEWKNKNDWKLPTAIGNYNVTIKENTAVGTGSSLNGTPTLESTAFNIVKKQLTVTVADQTVRKNDPTSIIQNGSVTIAEKLANDDTQASLNLTYSLDEEKVKIENERIISVIEGQNLSEAILVSIDNPNYEIATLNKGTLTISAVFTAELTNDGNAKDVISEAAANGSKYSEVTIKNVKLNGDGKWNTMVLPFDITPYDFCQAIGQYAVFNVLDRVELNDVKNKVYFTLEMSMLKANEPFLVKPVNTINLGDTKTEGEGDDAVTTAKYIFKNVTFKDADPIKDVTTAEFIGNYDATMPVDAGCYVVSGGIFAPLSESTNIGFTRAYMKINGGAASARFYVEDIESNGATAIKEISAETMKAIDNEGLYNLNGMKMQGVPTQKGIYIQNGKKVVIK